MKLRAYIIGIVLMTLPFLAMAGEKVSKFEAMEVEMADNFRQDGKIYVVIAVAAVLLAGMFTYLFLLDKKIGKIEKQLKK